MQQSFFRAIHDMLEDESSAYYALIRDVVMNIDEERLVSFGMNLGYNSCLAGTERIRRIKEQENIDVPWMISMNLGGIDYLRHASAYHSLIEQGERMGIYAWMLHVTERPDVVLELVEAFPQSAFMMVCSAEDITPAFLDEAGAVYHLMFAVRDGERIGDACALLRAGKFLYGIFHERWDPDEEPLYEILSDAETTHAVFTILSPEGSLSEEYAKAYQQILQARMQQRHRTIAAGMVCDNNRINQLISGGARAVHVTGQGFCYAMPGDKVSEGLNIFCQPLYDILKQLTDRQEFS